MLVKIYNNAISKVLISSVNSWTKPFKIQVYILTILMQWSIADLNAIRQRLYNLFFFKVIVIHRLSMLFLLQGPSSKTLTWTWVITMGVRHSTSHVLRDIWKLSSSSWKFAKFTQSLKTGVQQYCLDYENSSKSFAFSPMHKIQYYSWIYQPNIGLLG